MAEVKTKENDGDVIAFLSKVEPERKRQDCFEILELMREETGEEPKMWGGSIVGFGKYTYKYASGRTGDWMQTGFAPRKQSLTLYIMPGFDNYEDLLEKLGKYTTGKSCLYIKKLEDVDEKVLRKLVKLSVAYMAEKFPYQGS